MIGPLAESEDDPWEKSEALEADASELEPSPVEGAKFAELPAAAARAKSYPAWARALADHLYRTRTLALMSCPALEQTSKPGEGEGDFRARLSQLTREGRDRQVDELRKRYAPRLESLKERMRRAEQRVAREKSQFQQQTLQTAISVGATVLGALFGRKTVSAGTIGRATTAARGVGRSVREHEDVGSAQESVETLQQKMKDLDCELQEEIARAQDAFDPGNLALDSTELRPKKSDISVTKVTLIWMPEPAWR